MRKTQKNTREDMAEKALELTCRWLHRHKMVLEEKVTTDGLNTGISLRSPKWKAYFEDVDFPAWDRDGKPVPKEEAVLAVVEWLFGKSGDTCGDGPSTVVEKVLRDVSPGRHQIEIRTEPVPKFSFLSLKEFVLKAEASGEFGEC